jgi:hypothetical protein
MLFDLFFQYHLSNFRQYFKIIIMPIYLIFKEIFFDAIFLKIFLIFKHLDGTLLTLTIFEYRVSFA